MDLTPKMTITVSTVHARAGTSAEDRPGNGWPGNTDSRPRCGEYRDDTRKICLALKHHTGDHMAYGPVGQVCAQWPQAEPLADWERELLADRPDNRYQPEYRRQCRERHHGRGVTCLATVGHAGPHMPYYALGDGNGPSWPNDDGVGNDFAGLGNPTCGDLMASHPATKRRLMEAGRYYGYVCTARPGHTGDHMGWRTDGTRESDATWPQ